MCIHLHGADALLPIKRDMTKLIRQNGRAEKLESTDDVDSNAGYAFNYQIGESSVKVL